MIGLNSTTNTPKTGGKLRVALVHDYLNQYGGAERVLECLAEMFPEAPIYTLFYDKHLLRGKFKDRIIKTSFLDYALVRNHHRLFIPFFPKAAEYLNLKDEFDLIISDSAGFAKGVSHSRGIHISYVHSPLRYAWEPEHYLETLLPKTLIRVSKPILSYLRRWDYQAGQKPDIVIANSHFIAEKIAEFYDREAKVIHPPVDERFSSEHIDRPGNYFVAYGRMIHYKRFDLIIEAFNKLELPLLLVGAGPHRKKLEKMIISPQIKFLDPPSDEELVNILKHAKALIFPQIEDFGLVAAEAVSAGVPVIAYAEGGVKEIVEEGRNGVLFKKQHPDSIVKAVASFLNSDLDRSAIRENARKFSKNHFKKKFSEVVQNYITFKG